MEISDGLKIWAKKAKDIKDNTNDNINETNQKIEPKPEINETEEKLPIIPENKPSFDNNDIKDNQVNENNNSIENHEEVNKEGEIKKEDNNIDGNEVAKDENPELKDEQKESQENINNIKNPLPVQPQNPGFPVMLQPPMGMLPLNLQQGMPTMNFPNQISQPISPFLDFNNQMDDDDDDDDINDPILNDDTTDLNTVSTFALMENTALIVKKNLVERKWFLMRGEKILGNYNSEQLLYFLTSQIQKGNKFEDMSINDHTTDLHFKPSTLYDTLRKYVPKLKKRYLKKAMEENNEIMKKIQQQQQILLQNKQMNLLKLMQMNLKKLFLQ